MTHGDAILTSVDSEALLARLKTEGDIKAVEELCPTIKTVKTQII